MGISGVRRGYPGFGRDILGSDGISGVRMGISGVRREYPGFGGDIKNTVLTSAARSRVCISVCTLMLRGRGCRGTRVRGYEGTRVRGYKRRRVLDRGTRVLDPGFEGIRVGVRGY